MRKFVFIVLVSAVFSLACAGETITPPAILPSPSLPESAKKVWEKEWETTITKARKESKLTMYTTLESPDVRLPIAKEFKSKFGIDIEFISGKGPWIIPRLLTERRANIYMADVYLGGSSPMVTSLKPEGVFDSLDGILILPEVLESKMWYEGKIPFLDSAHTILTLNYAPSRPLWTNTSLAKPEELKSYMDLLNPKWKGRVIIHDPTIAGQGNQWFSVYGGVLLGFDYMQKLADQELLISRNQRLQAEWLARGKYAISIAVGWSEFEPFAALGAPLQAIRVAEGDYLTGASGHTALINKATHPNAARLFLNWIASKEGSTLLSKFYQRHSARLDVPTEFEGKKIFSFREEGVKYYNPESEEFLLKREGWVLKAQEIFGSLSK